jgi:hypothetical protein
MKASRRQQLRTNELAQNLAELIDFFKNNSGTVLAGVAAVVVIIGLTLYWYSARGSARLQGWSDFYGTQMVQAPEVRLANLRNIATKYKDPPLVTWAWLRYGELLMAQATSSGKASQDHQRLTTEAAEAFRTVVEQRPEQILAVAGARFAMAGLAEDQRRWDQARAHYQSVISDPRFAQMPQKQWAEAAQKRLPEIEQPLILARVPTTTSAVARPTSAAATKPAARRPSTRRTPLLLPTDGGKPR